MEESVCILKDEALWTEFERDETIGRICWQRCWKRSIMELNGWTIFALCGGYVLAATAFYTYVTVTSKEHPEYDEQPEELIAPAHHFDYTSPKSGKRRDRKAA
jgi:hypothetical protein